MNVHKQISLKRKTSYIRIANIDHLITGFEFHTNKAWWTYSMFLLIFLECIEFIEK